MQIGVIEVPTLKELLVQKIEDQILTGKLAVGEKLPSERALQDETHISKTVIHAAMVELEQKGFVEITPRRGTVVANFAETGTMETLNSLIRHNGGMMTKKQATSFLEARIAIEGAAMKKLAASHTEENISELSAILDKAEEAIRSGENISALADHFFQYHRSICVLSGNSFFPLLLNEFKPIIMVFWENSVRSFGAEQNVRLAGRYLRDIAAGDGERAYARLVRSSEQYLNSIIDE